MSIEQKILYFFDGDRKEYQKFLKRYSTVATFRNCNFSELVKIINEKSEEVISEKDFRSFLLSVEQH